MSWLRRRWRMVLPWVVLTVLVAVLARSVDWTRVATAMRELDPGWLVVAVAFDALLIVSWAGMIRSLFPSSTPVSFRRAFEITSISSAVMNTTPLYVGHASAVGLLIRRGKLAPTGALSVMALDQLGEGLGKVTVLTAAALLLDLPPWLRTGFLALAAAVALLFVVLLWSAHRFAEGAPVPHPRQAWLARLMERIAAWARGMDMLRSWPRSGRAAAFALGIKACEGLAIYAVQRAAGLDLGAEGAIIVLAATIIATSVPLSPANVGPYEGAAFLAYRQLGVPAEQALGIALVQHVAFLIPAVGTGYVVAGVRLMSAERKAAEVIASPE